MLEEFKYDLAKWIPFRDRRACEKIRAIKKEDLTKHPNPDFRIEVVKDNEFPFRLVMDIFLKIKKASDEDKKLVLILPQPEPLYSQVAYLINKFKVNCRKLYTFNMDEYADQDDNIAPETWPNSFLYAMKKNFYSKINPVLRPPESQMIGPTDKNFKDYEKMIEDMGGADFCHGAVGWSGHLAFIEPGAKEFAADSLEEWKKLGPKIVTLSPFTILQCSLDPEFGKSGDWSWIPPKAATIGPKQIIQAKQRSSWNGFTINRTMVSWHRFTVRFAAHGPVTHFVPASILQTLSTDFYISESVAEDIVAAEEFSWYD